MFITCFPSVLSLISYKLAYLFAKQVCTYSWLQNSVIVKETKVLSYSVIVSDLHGRDQLTPFQRRGHGRVELYLYPPSGPHQACNGITTFFMVEIKALPGHGKSRHRCTCEWCRLSDWQWWRNWAPLNETGAWNLWM